MKVEIVIRTSSLVVSIFNKILKQVSEYLLHLITFENMVSIVLLSMLVIIITYSEINL